MAGMVFFTDNYADRSSDDGYQFEFTAAIAATATPRRSSTR